MNVKRERLRSAIRFDETDIVPYNIQMKPEIRQQLVEYFGQPDLEEWMGNHSRYLFGPDWIQRDLGGNRIVSYYGSVLKEPDNPSIGISRVVEPALPKPTLSGFQFPDPYTVKLDPYPAGQDGLLMGYCLGCMETASYMRGFARTWMDFVEYPTFLHELMDAITEFVIGIMDRVSSYELDGFHIGDDWGSQRGLLVSPKHWRTFIKPRMTKMVEHAKSYGWIVEVHSDGDITEVLDDLVDMGIDMLDPVQPDCMDVFDIKRRYGENLALWGAVSNQRTIPFGTPEEIRQEFTRCFRELGRGGGYVLSTGKEMRPETPLENAVAVVETVMGQVPHG